MFAVQLTIGACTHIHIYVHTYILYYINNCVRTCQDTAMSSVPILKSAVTIIGVGPTHMHKNCLINVILHSYIMYVSQAN